VCTWFGTMCWVVVVSLQTCFRSCEQVKGKSQHVQIVSFQDLRQKSQKHCVENSRHCVPLCCKSFLWYIIYMIFFEVEWIGQSEPYFADCMGVVYSFLLFRGLRLLLH
jgi:hypothetical protein